MWGHFIAPTDSERVTQTGNEALRRHVVPSGMNCDGIWRRAYSRLIKDVGI